MQILLVSSLILAFLSPFFFVFCKIKFDGPIATMAKTFSSFCFILFSLLLYFNEGTTSAFGLFVILGLLFGLFGDIFLDLQDPTKSKDSPFLFGGIAAFSLEHILIITAVTLTLVSEYKPLFLLLSVFFGLIFTFAIAYVEKNVMKFEFGKSFYVVLLYSAVLATTFAYYLTASIFDPKFWIMFIGMTLFMISDCVLSVMYFNGKNQNFYLLLLNIATYYFGQILFALSIFFI